MGHNRNNHEKYIFGFPGPRSVFGAPNHPGKSIKWQ